MKRKKSIHFKRSKNFLDFWLNNIVNRKKPTVEQKEPESPGDHNWQRYWAMRG